MFQSLIIEEEVIQHPRSVALISRFPDIPHITCKRYGEVFNRKAQDFRLQKQNPSLILAKKHQNFVLPTPENYGYGGEANFYFSHMLNCLYDCRYCFLQGMYNSANYVLFVNFEDFEAAIIEKIEAHGSPTFFSGYDCDSLALDALSHFTDAMLPLFSRYPSAHLELRTKSLQIQSLLKRTPLPNVVTAYTLTPAPIAEALEHKAPSLERRLRALQKLQNAGWPIGLRFDPLIYCDSFREIYRAFFQNVFQVLDPENIHSITLGTFRLPKWMFKKMAAHYPEEKLFALYLDEKPDIVSYEKELKQELIAFCQSELQQFLPKNLIHLCQI